MAHENSNRIASKNKIKHKTQWIENQTDSSMKKLLTPEHEAGEQTEPRMRKRWIAGSGLNAHIDLATKGLTGAIYKI